MVVTIDHSTENLAKFFKTMETDRIFTRLHRFGCPGDIQKICNQKLLLLDNAITHTVLANLGVTQLRGSMLNLEHEPAQMR